MKYRKVDQMFRTVATVLTLLVIPSVRAQSARSAPSGMVHFVVGRVLLEEEPVKLESGQFRQVKVGQTLKTDQGRVEILLTPGMFLRLDQNTSFRMLSNQLMETRIEMLKGSALLEVEEIVKDSRTAVRMGDSQTSVLKRGLYHFDADAKQVRVFKGHAQVAAGSDSVKLTKGSAAELGHQVTVEKFRTDRPHDQLYAWSTQRALLLTQSNMSVARRINPKGFRTSIWALDSEMKSYTFIPVRGRRASPFGFFWQSPGRESWSPRDTSEPASVPCGGCPAQ